MSKTIIWFNRQLKLVSVMMLSSIIFIACADDQDASTQSPDSPSVKSGDPGANQEGVTGTKRRTEPKDMHDSTVTILALLHTDANQYPPNTPFILRLQPADTTIPALTSRGFGPWYGIKLKTPFNTRNKERLNSYIHGYLTYHDMAGKVPPIRHTIFLKWHGQGANLDSVTVWISPAPVMEALEYSDPPRPRVPPPPAME